MRPCAWLANGEHATPDEFLSSKGDGSISVLKAQRDGVPADESVKVTDADSGRVLEVAKRAADVELGGKTFHQYVLRPLKYEVEADAGRPRIELTSSGGERWGSVEDLPFVRDLSGREDVVVRPDPELQSGPETWFDVSSDRDNHRMRLVVHLLPDLLKDLPALYSRQRRVVCVERERSTYSRWIIGRPLCVSHSLHACMQAWQPMQRLGSMKNSRCWGSMRKLIVVSCQW